MQLTESHRHHVAVAQTRAARAYETSLDALTADEDKSIGSVLKETDLVQSLYAWAAAYAVVPGEENEPDTRRLTLEEEREAAMLMAVVAGTSFARSATLAEFLFEVVSFMEPDGR